MAGAEGLGLKRTKIGEIIPGELIAEVVESKTSAYAVGERISSFAPMVKYQVFRDDGSDRPDGRAPTKVPRSISSETALGFASALTAYIVANHCHFGTVENGGCFEFFKGCLGLSRAANSSRKTVLVTSAAGGVGVVAGQLYKNKGCRVIGVTSTRAKADRLKEYGFDEVIAYKEEDLDARLQKLVPEGLDLFFDNVGAEQLDAGSKHMKIHGKIVQVGCAAEIDNYATGNISGWKEYHRMAARELQVGGFLLSNHLEKIPRAILALTIMASAGKLKTANTLVSGGWDKFTDCVDRLREGDTFGRLILAFDA